VLRSVRTSGEEHGFNLERDLEALEAAIIDVGAVLVIADPLSAYLGSKDSYRDSEIRGLLTPLAALAERHRVAVIGILHLTKAAQARLLLRAQGNVAFVAQARTVLAVGQDQNAPGRRLLVSVKNNLGPQAPALAFRIGDHGVLWEPGPVEGSAEKLLAMDEVVSRSERHERDLAATFLRDLLRSGPVPSKEVKANGIAQRTLWRAKADLGVIAERMQSGNRWAWSWALPAEDRP
jgi:putative DNA primase/helicase